MAKHGVEKTSSGPEISQLHETDTGTLTAAQRQAFAALLRGPFISVDKQPEIFRTVSANREVLAQQLDNLFLTLIVDDSAGVAYAKNWDTDIEGSRILMRKHPLTFMETVVLLHLRHMLVMTSPNERAVVGEEEVFEATLPYQSAAGNDKAAQRKKFQAAWNKMKDRSIVRTTTTEDRFEMSPVLRLIFTAEEVAAVSDSFASLLDDDDDDSGETVTHE